jgi:hypothetical protein
MNAPLSLPPVDDLDTTMLKVARAIAMGLYELPDILKNHSVDQRDFNRWKDHPRFIHYLQTETVAWEAATNTAERTKLKAAVVMEMFMEEAHTSLHDKKTPLNQRVELGKLVSRIAGLGEPRVLNAGGGGSSFNLQINIGPGVPPVNIRPEMGKLINYDDAPAPSGFDALVYGDDDYDPLVSPNTLED